MLYHAGSAHGFRLPKGSLIFEDIVERELNYYLKSRWQVEEIKGTLMQSHHDCGGQNHKSKASRRIAGLVADSIWCFNYLAPLRCGETTSAVRCGEHEASGGGAQSIPTSIREKCVLLVISSLPIEILQKFYRAFFTGRI